MTTDEPDDLTARAAKYGAGIHTDPAAARQLAIESSTAAVDTTSGPASIPWGKTSRYHFVSYIENDDPGDVTTGMADRVPIDAAIARLADGAKVEMADEAKRYRLFYARAALVDAEPASPELAALEMEITSGVMDALKRSSYASRCDTCGRESIDPERLGKLCGAVIYDQRRLSRTRQMAHEDLAAGGRYGATPELVKIWNEYDGKCRGVMTAVIR